MASKTLQELTSRLADAFGFSRLFKFRPVVVLAEQAGGWDGSQAWTQGTCQSKDQQTGSRVGRGSWSRWTSKPASSVTTPGCHQQTPSLLYSLPPNPIRLFSRASSSHEQREISPFVRRRVFIKRSPPKSWIHSLWFSSPSGF